MENSENKNQTTVRTYKVPAPTWEGSLGILLETHKNGSTEGKKIAFDELVKMSKCADLYLSHLDSEIEK